MSNPRHIQPKLVDFIDNKLSGNGLAQLAITDKNARAVFRLAAESLVGTREKGGNNSGPMVELIQRTLGSADRESWCMSFIQTCLAYAELKTGKISPIYPSEHCLTVWRESPTLSRVRSIPDVGAICIWQHGETSNGHTGLTISAVKSDQFQAIEGNTESGIVGGVVESDGGGVYHTIRGLHGTPSMHVVGFLKPF